MATRTVKDFLYEKEAYALRGACFDVWNALGGGFKEKVVEVALKKALLKRGLSVESQKRLKVYYEDEAIGVYQPDFVINDCILLELKVKPALAVGDRKQFWQYLKGSHYRLGFLVHFGSERLQIHRVVYDRARSISGNQRVDQR